MERLSEAEENLRKVAHQKVDQLIQDLKSKKISADDCISQLAELERIHRLQADQASAPIYAEELMRQTIVAKLPEEIFTAFKTIYKSRAQSALAQEVSSHLYIEFLRQYCERSELRPRIELLKQTSALLRGAIHVEDVFVEAEVLLIDALALSNNIQEAAQHAEQLQTDTAVTIPFETRLGYILKQFSVIRQLGNTTRSLLAFQKYNDQLVLKQTKTDQLMSLRRDLNLEMALTYFEIRNLEKLALCWFRAADSTGDVELMNNALVAAFCCQDKALLQQIKTHETQPTTKLRAMCDSVQVQKVDELRDVKDLSLTKELKSGFLLFQLEKMSKIYKTVSFKRVEELLNVNEREVEALITAGDIQAEIDREAAVIEFISAQVKTAESKIQGVLQGVLDVAYQVYALKNEK